MSFNQIFCVGPVAFLKSHLGSYFECIDTLDNLEVRFGEDSDKFLDNVDSLIDRISSARDLSNRTYEAVFQRRQKIDLYRHCISTVNRFHYVFDLLSSIHKNIKTRHFRAVVTDHKKLQQLLGRKFQTWIYNLMEFNLILNFKLDTFSKDNRKLTRFDRRFSEKFDILFR